MESCCQCLQDHAPCCRVFTQRNCLAALAMKLQLIIAPGRLSEPKMLLCEVVGEEWGQRILIAVQVAEISAFFEEQHFCKNGHHSLLFGASLMWKYTIRVQLLPDLAGCYFCRVPCLRRDTAAIRLGATRWFPTAVKTQAMASLGWAPT